MFKNIIANNFPNLDKHLPIQEQEASRIPNRLGNKFSLFLSLSFSLLPPLILC
jgi:hypothetical protein